MSKVSVEEAAHNLQALLKRVAAGEEIILVEQDKLVARLVPPSNKEKFLAEMKEFRDSLTLIGEPLSHTVITERQEEQY